MAGPIANPSDGGARSEFTNRFASLGSGEILARLVAFLATAYLARKLGPYGFGVVGFAAAICSYLSIGVTAGFNAVGAREVARNQKKAAALAGGVVVVRLILATVAMAITGAVALLLDKPETVRWVVILTSLTFLTLALDTAWVYKGLGRTGKVGIALVMAQLGYLGAVLAFVQNPSDVVWVPLAQFLGELLAALFLGLPLFLQGSWAPQVREGFRILVGSRALALSRFLRTMIFSFDVVLLSFLVGEAEVGLYTAAYRICLLVLAVGVALHSSYLPEFARAAKSGDSTLTELTTRSIFFAWSLALPMLVGGSLLAQPMLRDLFGSPFDDAAQAFRILLLSATFIFVNGALRNIYLATHRLRIETWIIATAAGLNVVLNILLIPRFGMVGAAAATAFAEGLILAWGMMLIRRWSIRPRLAGFVKVIAATLGMAALLAFWGPAAHWLLRLLVGVLAYFSLLAILKGIPEDLRLPWRTG
jgi:O-antigen/teichoic acid export membrane protein